MKLTFNQTANGTYELEFKVSTDFNLHVERTDASQDLYVYYRGSSEGEYKFYKKYYGKVVDEDINIVDNIVPKFFKVKSASNPVLCEVTGEVEVVIGGEDKPGQGGGGNYDFNQPVFLVSLDEGNDFYLLDKKFNLLHLYRGNENTYLVNGNEFTFNQSDGDKEIKLFTGDEVKIEFSYWDTDEIEDEEGEPIETIYTKVDETVYCKDGQMFELKNRNYGEHQGETTRYKLTYRDESIVYVNVEQDSADA